jgi:hypothetical protein
MIIQRSQRRFFQDSWWDSFGIFLGFFWDSLVIEARRCLSLRSFHLVHCIPPLRYVITFTVSFLGTVYAFSLSHIRWFPNEILLHDPLRIRKMSPPRFMPYHMFSLRFYEERTKYFSFFPDHLLLKILCRFA